MGLSSGGAKGIIGLPADRECRRRPFKTSAVVVPAAAAAPLGTPI